MTTDLTTRFPIIVSAYAYTLIKDHFLVENKFNYSFLIQHVLILCHEITTLVIFIYYFFFLDVTLVYKSNIATCAICGKSHPSSLTVRFIMIN